MKTLKEVEKEIIEITKEATGGTADDKEKNKARKKLHIYTLARNYLELSPTKQSVVSQKELVLKYLKIHEERYLKWFASLKNPVSEPRKVFAEQFDIDLKEISKWKSELKFLNYILS